ncbi:MAG: TonB C-terminal domain-containing protein [Betaproteobacteria bacterium]
MKKDRPGWPTRPTGRWLALALAVAVHAAFIAVLVFSVRWQNRPPEPVTAELYAPPAKAAVVDTPAAVPEPTPPQPTPAPAPPPAPAPKPEPVPPAAVPKPEPKAGKPDPRAAEIAQKARLDEDRKKREVIEREKQERERKEADKRERDRKDAEKREAEKRKADEQKRAVETRERQSREAEALRAQAEREKATRDAQQKVADAEAAARARAEADYIRRIQSKVKGNVILPPDLAGNPEAIFDLIQLPTGEIIDAVLRKSSGVRAYDDAVQRAIVKSSPLPRPDRPDLFQRTLTLKFRPQD